MRRLCFFAAAFVLWAPAASAQMMPDSTVQVVAYWNLGDKHHYRFESVKSDIVGTDTTIVDKSAEIVSFEVVAADEEKGYRVKVTSLESQFSDPMLEIIDRKWRERFGEEAYSFETGPFGDFQRVLPIEGLDEQRDALVQEIADGIIQKQGGTGDREQILDLARQMISQESLTLAVISEYAPLLLFHRGRFDLDREYEFQDETPSIFGSGQAITMDGRFWVDEELTDDYSVVLRLYKNADQEQLAPYLTALLGQLVGSLAEDEDEREQARQEVEKAYRDAAMTLEDFIFEEVHLGTGWPIQYHHTREVLIKIGGQEKEQLVEKTVTLLE